MNRMMPKIMPLLVAACLAPALANPLGPQVAQGQASFQQQGNVLAITNTPGTIINWQAFSINPNEVTRFIQQSSASSVLNRIVGQDPSQILGALQSNGRVFLINPNGILFGQEARIDVNGLVASTLSIGNGDFLANRLNFHGINAGNISNAGAITTPAGGQVYLIAPNVANSGIITSPRGDVLLAAGHTVQLADAANPELRVVLSAPEHEALNLGQIVAQGGQAGIYGALVRQRGIVSADSAVIGDNGRIVFRASRETIVDGGSRTTATGAGKGGEIRILGERVGVTGDAVVDASGKTGGGTVLVGGDYQGKNADVVNAKRTYVGPQARIRADAIENGDGGKVIVWSDEVTRNYGSISARGGEQGGNGGFVESSGKQYLDHHATVDVSAPKGSGGTLLLDPATITLEGGTGDGAAALDGAATFLGGTIAGTVNFADPDLTSAGVSKIYQSELQGLAPGTNIVLEATDSISASGSFSNLITLPANANLTMRTRNAATDGSGTIGINLAGSADASNLEFKTQGTGTITLQTGTGASPQFATIDVGKLTTSGGQVSVNASGNAVIRAITTTPAAPGNGGNIAVTSTAGYLSLGGGNIDARGNSGAAGNVTLSSAGPISMQNTKTIYGNQLRMSAVSGIYGTASTDSMATQVSALQAQNAGAGPIRISNGTDLAIQDLGGSGYGVKQISPGKGITIATATGKTLGVGAPVVANAGSIALTGGSGLNLYATSGSTISSAGGTIDLAATDAGAKIATAAGSLIDSGGNTVTLSADRMSLLGTINAAGAAVALKPLPGTPIDIGTSDTIDAAAKLELNNAELGGIAAGRLTVGDANSGALTVMSTLGTGFSSLSLLSGGAITQQPGALLGGATSLRIEGASVTLTEANPTGVIAGGTTTGDFMYRSANGIAVTTVDGKAGITVPGAASVFLRSDHASGINQSSPITGGALAMQATGPAMLNNGGNNLGKIAADLDLAGTGTGSFSFSNSAGVSIDSVLGINGIATNKKDVFVKTAGGTLTIAAPVTAANARTVLSAPDLAVNANVATSSVVLEGDTLALAGTVTASLADIHTFTAARPITIGAGCGGCLSVTNLYAMQAPTIGIGAAGSPSSGAITVAGITAGGTGSTDRNALTTRIGLLSGAGVTQTPGTIIDVQDLGVAAGGSVSLPEANVVANFAGRTTAGNLGFNSANPGGLTIATLSGGTAPNDYLIAGASAPGSVQLSSVNGSITGTAAVKAGALTASAPGGIALTTAVGSFAGSASAANSHISIINSNSPANDGSLTVQNVSNTGAAGSIDISNVGYLKVAGTVSTADGSIHLRANSPLTVAGTGIVTSSSGNIVLEAGASGSSSDKLQVLAGASLSTGAPGTITLKAGDAIDIAGTVSGNLTKLEFQNAAATTQPPPPTLDQCTATPTLAGCSSVLPGVDQCAATPALAGCAAVLPTLSQCTATPTLAGCTAVLPTLSQCTATPALSGCGTVLPTLSKCAATPTLEGCSAVLPTLSQCTATPSLPGCGNILPSLSACMTNPASSGCNAVLPTLSQCSSTPSLPGCGAVLPTLSQCAASPTLSGCSAILPTLSQCTANATLPGCDSVLPALARCTLNPTLPECGPALAPPADKPATQLAQEISTTVTTTVSTTGSTVTATMTAAAETVAAPGGGNSGTSSGSDGRKADRTTAGLSKDGVKQNEAARKLYCN